MMITRWAVAAAALLVSVPASALTLVETFETLGPKDTILSSIATSIGTIQGLAGNPIPNVVIASPGYTNFGPGNNPTTSSVLAANGDEKFEANLVFAAKTVGMDVYLNDFGPATLDFYNGATLLGSLLFPAADPNFQTVSFTAAGPLITRFVFTSTGGGILNTGIDNISISDGRGVVPEPASWAMLIAGFGLVGAVRRRQRVAAA